MSSQAPAELTDDAVAAAAAVVPRPRLALPGIRKAAILMIALGDELARKLIQNLPEGSIQRLTAEIAMVQEVEPALSAQVLEEFAEMLGTQQCVVRGGLDYASRVLVEAFGNQRAEDLLNQVKRAQEASHGNLAMLQKVDPQQLGKFLDNEHPQTIALVLAHLDPKRGAQVLDGLAEEQRVAAIERLAEMRQFSPEMAQKVAMVLHQRLESMGDSGRRSYSGYKAVADLLNRLEGDSAKKLLERVERESPEVAISIRNHMFTFEDILTVPAASVREIVSGVDKRQLALALKGTSEDLRVHVYKAMSARAAEMLKEDMDLLGPVRSREVMAAQQEVLNLARRLEMECKIILRLEQGDGLMV